MRKKILLSASGFSLLEVSISLLIIGIVSTMTISQLATIKRINSCQITRTNIEFVIKVIGIYCAQKDDVGLPFPSRTDTDIGVQSKTMKDTFGFVPYKTLGMMERMVKNGDGIMFMYKMNPMFKKSISDKLQKDLGVSEFASEISGDKVAIILKSVNKDGKDDMVVWYSEKNFIANYVIGNKQPVEKQTCLKTRTSQPVPTKK
jgi:prepilin-type N-terminal cleavage/methylation domain-containing protein